MRKLKKLFLAALMVVGFNVAAQAQEVAHINVSELIPLMPESKTAKDELTKLQDKYKKELETMQKDFQTKGQKYQSEAATAGDALNQTRMKEMQEMEERIGMFAQNAQQEMAKKEMALSEPILTKAQQAIHKVARAKGYKYVLDSTIGSGVILADGPNLMAEVKKELKILN
ncbi:OmpH family outer membrane protein [Myroides sp. JBRI-B21084]|uniref:OmpH family outer membrane protein n=1 Tax=Myroides sp. JBRI-B21084 TaxID=3119977 RepID=UPI0026E458D8|nr:OmpH family outer membrane protein [Paenimyroides cloacae]WKW46459.1 OmpH family outer membrane protein [Paenimyroides cloacae]